MSTNSRSARYAKWLSIPAGLALSGLLIWQASYAAFSDTAESRRNSWTAGNVTIDRVDDSSAALFYVPNLAPGQSGSETVTVTYKGTLDARVSFYGTSTTSSELANYIDLVVEGTEGSVFGSGATGAIYEGTLADFVAKNSTYETGLQYNATGDAPFETGSFKFTYTMRANAPSELQDEVTDIDFVVEARSRP